MLNSEFTNEQAAAFAADVAELHESIEKQVAEVLQRVLQRQPTAAELERGQRLIASLQAADESVTPRQALKYFCLLAINLNEFVYID